MLDTMTSWFIVSDALTRVAVMVCVVCVTGGQLGAAQKCTTLQCSEQRWLDVREDATTCIKCEGSGAQQTVMWRIVSNSTVTVNSTCEPDSTVQLILCNETYSDIHVYSYDNGLTRSELHIINNHRELASDGRVDCYFDDTSSATCRTNVISPAVLSDCEVTMITHQTLAGTCNFTNAYSSNGTYTCTWTLTPTDIQTGNDTIIIPGDINKTEQTSNNGKVYYRGTCSFTRQIPGGQYTYTVHFFPGKPGRQYQGSVNVTVPPTTNGSTTTVPPTTTGFTTTESSSTKQPVPTTGSSKVPLVAVIGGAVAAVVVIAVVVIVVVCIVIRRNRRKENIGKDCDEDRDFEMHVNAAYVSAGELDQDSLHHQQPFKPSGVTPCIPSNNAAFTTTSPTGRPTSSPATANHNTDNDYDYSTIKDEGDDTIDPGYTSVSLGGAERPFLGGGGRGFERHAADDEDIVDGGYSEIGDNINNDAPKAPGNRGRSSDGGGGGDTDDMYANLDKNSQCRELQPSASGGGDACDDVGDMYARVTARLRPAASEDGVHAELAGLPSTTAPGDDAFSEDYSHLNLAHNGRVRAPAVAPPPAASQPISHSDVSSFDDYAHLDHGLRAREDGPILEELSGESGRDVYAQVNKSSTGNNLTPSPEGRV